MEANDSRRPGSTTGVAPTEITTSKPKVAEVAKTSDRRQSSLHEPQRDSGYNETDFEQKAMKRMKKFLPRKAQLKKVLSLLALAIVVYIGRNQFDRPNGSAGGAGRSDDNSAGSFDGRKSGAQTEGSGIVVKILPDDNHGSRHQRFLLKLQSGQTLLIAHNIDLAPRLFPLSEGDAVAFNGEFEWNEKGGVIHWTHRDPRGRHAAGWLKHKGQTYQ